MHIDPSAEKNATFRSNMKQSAETDETFLEPIKRCLEFGEDMMLEPRRVVTYRCSDHQT